jgi:prepilin-type N-terminal cleavage/methylation domain-containing protein/prepilin-type processing-associated H-X9-DG protein
MKIAHNFEGGFTLSELIVVLAIIGVVAALLLPELARSKAKAKQAACANNVRQLGNAMEQFETDYQVFPPAAIPAKARGIHPEYHIAWQYALNVELSRAKPPPIDGFFDLETTPGPEEWVGTANGPRPITGFWRGVWACPSAAPPPNLPERFGMTSYGYNKHGLGNGLLGLGGTSFLSPGGTVTAPAVRASDVANPSGMIAIGDGFAGNDGIVNELSSLYRGGRTTNKFGYYEGSTQHAAARHGSRATIVFCDGHVESPTFQLLFQETNDAALQLWNRDHQPHRENLE